MNPVLDHRSPTNVRRNGGPSVPGYRVAVLGATGAVGSEVLKVLGESDLPINTLTPVTSPRSVGTLVTFRGEDLACVALADELVDSVDLVISAAGGAVIEDWAHRFADAGAFVIDKSSAFRMDDDVPLVVPEVNPEALTGASKIIASPNCSTIQLVVALSPIHRTVGIERIIVSTYQSVSGTGKRAVDELNRQLTDIVDAGIGCARSSVPPEVYPHQIAFNALPQVESFVGGDPYTTEERKIEKETRKILGDKTEQIGISATCVRVPVHRAHSESVNVETSTPLSATECRELLRHSPGLQVVDEPEAGHYPMAIDAEGKDDVFVGRIREDASRPNCLNLWVVGDNLRKGAATNAVRIAEALHSQALLRVAVG
jgi:aspartate-semialdehyde dehydrogenase